tara:strand:- start:231 stop:1151 length:921 start_codon:yes stop_codon:yes gene_type:complete
MYFSVLTVIYNNFDVTKDLVESIFSTNYPYLNIVIIDNSISQFNGIKKFEKKFKLNIINKVNQKKLKYNRNIYYFRSEKNIGYGAAINKATDLVVKCNPEYLVILNNDTKVPKDFFLNISSYLSEVKPLENSLLSPIIKKTDDDSIWYAGGEINLVRCMGVHHNKISNKSYYETDFITGCCIICKPDTYQQLGGFDEKYFLYYEDVDLSLQAKKKKIKIFILSNLSIHHSIGVSTGGDNSQLTLYFSSRNRIYLMRKNFSSFVLYRFLCFFLINRIVKIIISFLTGNLKNIKFIILGIIRGLRIEI